MKRLIFFLLITFLAFGISVHAQTECATKSQGDADCDGKSDIMDFEKWWQDYLSGVYNSRSDFNTDSEVTLFDYELWRRQYVSRSLTSPTPSIKVSPAITTVPSAEGNIKYGTDGNGIAKTSDCTVYVDAGQSINNAISGAAGGAVICVRGGNYSTQTVTLNKSNVTVRALAKAEIKGADVSGAGSTFEGFTVVGGAYKSPETGITFSGSNVKILNNLINGTELIYGISCPAGSCNSALISGNTVTGIESIGMYIDNGTGTVVERNNIYDLVSSRGEYDVDGIRFWGTNHIFRYNYIHDINQFKSFTDSSGDTPHTDCFQTYNSGSKPVDSILIENNYCVRVSRQCLIAQNHTSTSYTLKNIIFRNNVCETYDSQAINLGGMSGVTIDNNLIVSGFRYQIIALVQEDFPLPPTNTTIRNNILVKTRSSADTYLRENSLNEVIQNNLEITESSFDSRDDTFHATRGSFAAVNPADFTGYRSYAQGKNIINRGIGIPVSATDIDGGQRMKGSAVEIGPFEIQ